MISNQAYIHPDAKLGKNVTVEPFAYIAGDVVIGDDCWIGPGAVIHDGARIGKGCKIHTAASIACTPQDLKFVGEKTTAEIGDYNEIRECVTISRGTASRGKTVVGSHNLIMAYVHIAHDDVVGSQPLRHGQPRIARRRGRSRRLGRYRRPRSRTSVDPHRRAHDDSGRRVGGQGHSPLHHRQQQRSGTFRLRQSRRSEPPRIHAGNDLTNSRRLPHPLPKRPELPERL